MCINQKTIINRRYVRAVKCLPGNDRLSPSQLSSLAENFFREAKDLYLLVDCGCCLPCLKKRANYWRQRLLDEFHYYVSDDSSNKYKVYFVTLTVAPQYYKNDINHVRLLFKKFRERYRKRFGCSLRFWCCSEYGEKRGRLHLHAIFFNPLFEATQLKDLWKYGRCDMSVVGCSLKNPSADPTKGIAYVTKYITKTVDKWFVSWDQRSFVWCSPGIGKRYTLDPRNRLFHQSRGPLFFRVDDTGRFPMALSRYYVGKLFSPLDCYERSLSSLKRLHSPIDFPVTVGNRVFHSFAPYVHFVNSVGGCVNLLSTQLDKMSVEDRLIYFSQVSKYE